MAADPVRLVHITDPHLFADSVGEMRGVVTEDSLRRVLEHARAERWPPAAILVTGDIAQDESRGAYRRFRSLLEPLALPVYCLPGNHDNPDFMRELLDDGQFETCASVVYGDWRITMLDSYVAGQPGGRLSADELTRLDDALGRNPGRHDLVCLHHQPVAVGSRWLDGVGLVDGAAFLATLARHHSVRGVLWGHVHQEFDEQREGVRFMSTPSTCAQFLPRSDDFALDEAPPAYRWLELHPDGRIDSAVVWVREP